MLSAFQQRVKDKQREWEGFTKVQKQTKQLDAFMKDLGDRTDLLEHGGEGELPSSSPYVLVASLISPCPFQQYQRSSRAGKMCFEPRILHWVCVHMSQRDIPSFSAFPL